MAWIESHVELGDHPKLRELCFSLGIKKYEAVGHLTLLWHFALKYAWRDGDLRRFTPRVICDAVGWDKDHDTFVMALQETGWLEKDSLQIHDWLSYAGKLVNDRLYNEERRENAVKRRKTSSNAVNPRKSTATVPNPTLPNRTKDLKTTEPLKDKGSSTPLKPSATEKGLTDLQKVVTAFKVLQGFPRDDKKWDEMYFGRFSKSAAALIKFLGNWKDAVDCCEDVYSRLTEKGLTVTMETIVKHAGDWLREKREREAKHGVFPVPSVGSVSA